VSEPCPICGSPLQSMTVSPGGRDVNAYDCRRCGKFMLVGSLLGSLPHLHATYVDAGPKLSHSLRRAQDAPEPILLNTYTAEAIVKQSLPRPREQADLLIRWIAGNVPGPGETVWIEFSTHGSIIGAKSVAGFELILDHLFAIGLVTGVQAKTLQGGDRAHVRLTFSGWEYYEQLRAGGAVYRKAFMAMKFGDDLLTSVLESVFKPSAKRAGFDLIKLDDIPRAGLIDDRLRVEIQSADFVVADLTHDNLGAYWEAGYAEGLGKPVIYTCEKARFSSAKTHFDTNHHLTILWDAAAPEAAGKDLLATIRATLPHLAVLVDGDV
jgi:hypothetical protein